MVLAVLNVASRADGRPTPAQIWAGQYVGTGVLVLASLLAASGLARLPGGWLSLFGLIPLVLGLRKLVKAVRDRRTDVPSPAVATGFLGVTGLTIANGGDNLAAYTPVFRTLAVGDIALTLVVFVLGVAVWCVVGARLVSHHQVAHVIGRWGQWIVPVLFILIALYTIEQGGLFR